MTKKWVKNSRKTTHKIVPLRLKPCSFFVMIKKTLPKFPVLTFGLPFEGSLDSSNRWVQLAGSFPWEAIETAYLSKMCADNGRPSLPARLVLGALIIKHYLNISDAETILQIQENPYLQYFVGLEVFQKAPIFDPSLFVAIRTRLSGDGIAAIEKAIAQSVRSYLDSQVPAKGSTTQATSDDAPPEQDPPIADKRANATSAQDETEQDTTTQTESQVTHRGHLKIDATVAPQKIKFPTDLDLLNEARKKTDNYIDLLCAQLNLPRQNFRTYRRIAYKNYLNIAKKKKKKKKELQVGIRQQLGYLKRNLLFVKALIEQVRSNEPQATLKGWRKKELKEYETIQKLYEQQKKMYDNQKRTCENRIVSISQPYVRPIVRGKQHVSTEFGAKIGIATVDGITTIDNFSWEAYNENQDLETHINRYKELYGVLPESVNADRIYLTQKNRALAKQLGFRLIGKPLGRPKKEDQTAKAKRIAQVERNQRNIVEGKIGQTKNRYGLDRIAAKSNETTRVWVTCCIIATNIARWLKALSLCPFKIWYYIRNYLSYYFIFVNNTFFNIQ